jgi:hypothetical protein
MTSNTLLIDFAMCALVAGCAGTSQYQGASEPINGPSATVHVTRGFGPGTAISAPVYVNNNLIGKIGPGGELFSPVPVGALRVRSTSNTVSLQAAAGAIYAFEVSLPLQLWLAEPDFEIRVTGASGGLPSIAPLPAPSANGPAPPSPQPPVLKPAGEWSYSVEKVARDGKCAAEPKPQLTGKGPGFETYVVQCFSGDVINVRCEFGQCPPLR